MKGKIIFKSILLGILIVFLCLLPLGIFTSLFWNNWHQDGTIQPETNTIELWFRIARDAVFCAISFIVSFWFVTIPFVLLYARWNFKRLQKPPVK